MERGDLDHSERLPRRYRSSRVTIFWARYEWRDNLWLENCRVIRALLGWKCKKHKEISLCFFMFSPFLPGHILLLTKDCTGESAKAPWKIQWKITFFRQTPPYSRCMSVYSGSRVVFVIFSPRSSGQERDISGIFWPEISEIFGVYSYYQSFIGV